MRQSATNINHKKVQLIPADKKLGFPQAALNRSCSARTAHTPNLYCAPTPLAPLVLVRLSSKGGLGIGPQWRAQAYGEGRLLGVGNFATQQRYWTDTENCFETHVVFIEVACPV
jgi:hypothetical protein